MRCGITALASGSAASGCRVGECMGRPETGEQVRLVREFELARISLQRSEIGMAVEPELPNVGKLRFLTGVLLQRLMTDRAHLVAHVGQIGVAAAMILMATGAVGNL